MGKLGKFASPLGRVETPNHGFRIPGVGDLAKLSPASRRTETVLQTGFLKGGTEQEHSDFRRQSSHKAIITYQLWILCAELACLASLPWSGPSAGR